MANIVFLIQRDSKHAEILHNAGNTLETVVFKALNKAAKVPPEDFLFRCVFQDSTWGDLTFKNMTNIDAELYIFTSDAYLATPHMDEVYDVIKAWFIANFPSARVEFPALKLAKWSAIINS